MKVPDHWWGPADSMGIRHWNGEGPELAVLRGYTAHLYKDMYEALCGTDGTTIIDCYVVGHEYTLCRACYKLHTTGGG
jgi:hypothetical protein